MNRPQCRTCRKWGLPETWSGAFVGDWWREDCRARSPIGVRDRDDNSGSCDRDVAVWPTTRAVDWCGDHEPRALSSTQQPATANAAVGTEHKR